jgi:predicted transcriptional regulator
MSGMVKRTVELPEQVDRAIDQLARALDRPADSVVAEALASHAAQTFALMARLAEAEADAAAGRTVAHEEAMARLDALIAGLRPDTPR